MIDQEVIVVCLNEFLAFWSSTTYGSPFVTNGTIRYMSLQKFLKLSPEEGVLVIVDEVDQIVGRHSFKLKFEPDSITPFYLPSFLTSWGQIIGFSGTMSEATT